MEPASQRESQFHTQAARLVESQSNGEEVAGPLEDVRTEGGDAELEAEDPIEWESSPERPKKTKTVIDLYNCD